MPTLRSIPIVGPPTVDQVREAAARVDPNRFLERLRWLPDLDWGAHGSYCEGVIELEEVRALELLGDLRQTPLP